MLFSLTSAIGSSRAGGRYVYLVFDTETTGLPISWKAPIRDVDNWPRVVQLAWTVFDETGRKTGADSYVVRPTGYKIPKSAEEIHGISTAKARQVGVSAGKVFGLFAEAIGGASVVVAHNLSFDASVVRAEFHRLGILDLFRRKTHVCTKEVSTEFCALPGRYGFKWPTLSELHLKLFGRKVRETHEASQDVATCAKCFFELKRIGVVRIGRSGLRWLKTDHKWARGRGHLPRRAIHGERTEGSRCSGLAEGAARRKKARRKTAV